uniref:Uncharacterized protein n=1 Tax=Oryza punctata TaxID=4537 RepID=A0A0E0KJ54_ORYPU
MAGRERERPAVDLEVWGSAMAAMTTICGMRVEGQERSMVGADPAMGGSTAADLARGMTGSGSGGGGSDGRADQAPPPPPAWILPPLAPHARDDDDDDSSVWGNRLSEFFCNFPFLQLDDLRGRMRKSNLRMWLLYSHAKVLFL